MANYFYAMPPATSLADQDFYCFSSGCDVVLGGTQDRPWKYDGAYTGARARRGTARSGADFNCPPPPLSPLHSRRCHYSGKYFCGDCFGSQTSLIPSSIIYNCDFTPYPVRRGSPSVSPAPLCTGAPK